MVREKKHHPCWWNGSRKNNTIHCFLVPFIYFWKRQGTFLGHCSSLNSGTLEKNCIRMDKYELHPLLWPEWSTRKKKHPILWMVSLQHHHERNHSPFRTQQIPDIDHQLWSILTWLPGCDYELAIPIRYCWRST